jgi:hypothetical protein
VCILSEVKTVKIVFKNGSVIESPETLDTQRIRGQEWVVWLDIEEDEENDVIE